MTWRTSADSAEAVQQRTSPYFRRNNLKENTVSKSEGKRKVGYPCHFRKYADPVYQQELSYRQQIARQLRTEYADGI